MENLEEVLQALDEFQKMRPSEIPRELEDYLCWVAKTGDPVYQWSLIKTLFREKLTRVMTDFYESCPTLELAPCPNVEQFNYDTMKSNLLERLESFANAPFTVQRICELLTAPRKEYNRVDKFMRAIEKNILVVSTREPGPIARRSENGDSMVNGSVDDETSVTQPPQDVEMEYWEKDCTSTVTISVHTVENETPLLHTVIPTTTVVKNVFGTDESSQEKLEQASPRSEITVSNFIPSTSEFSGVTNLSSPVQPQDSTIAPAIQNLSTIVPETSGIVGDVPEAIMNEDTSSQPSLDLENEETEAADSTRKLQTTFQAKDFTLGDSKSSKFYLDNAKTNEKMEESVAINSEEGTINSTKVNETLSKSNLESKTDNRESVNPIVENLLKASNGKIEDKIKTGTVIENSQTPIDEDSTLSESKETSILEDTNSENKCSIERIEKNITSMDCADTLILPGGNTTSRLSQSRTNSKETLATSEDISLEAEHSKQRAEGIEITTEDLKPIIEEPSSKENAKEDLKSFCSKKDSVTITEEIEDEARIIKSVVLDPIPIIEEPKDVDADIEKLEKSASIVEITEDAESQIFSDKCQSENNEKLISVENHGLPDLQTNKGLTTMKLKDNESLIIENVKCKRESEPVELMEVDEEESLSIFNQDEPMEQETTESSKS